jgi:aminopeptidase-like protein
LLESYNVIVQTIDVIENNDLFWNTVPKCEPQLGRRGLYGRIGGKKETATENMAMLWVLNLSDGSHSLLDIAERSGLPFEVVRRVAQLLQAHGLLTGEPHDNEKPDELRTCNGS